MRQARYLYSELAQAIQARANCKGHFDEPKNGEWFAKHTETIKRLVNLLPSGSGIDTGPTLNLDESHAEKFVFNLDYHHMNENGFYDGWTFHTLTVTPSFTSGVNIRISGRNRNDIKDYLHDTFHTALCADVTYHVLLPFYPQYAVTSKWENKDGTPSECSQALYVGEKRFWNSPNEAMDYAAEKMFEQKMYDILKPLTKFD